MSAQKKEKSKAKKQLKAIILKSLRQISSCGYCKFKLCAVDYTVAKRLSQQHFRISPCVSQRKEEVCHPTQYKLSQGTLLLATSVPSSTQS